MAAMPAAIRLSLLVLALCAGHGTARMAARMTTRMMATTNPVRRVVNMLQAMQSKVAAEGKKEQELFDKFMCYCKTGSENLQNSIEAAKTKIPSLESDIEKASAEKKQLGPEIAQAKKDRAAAMQSMQEASSLRDKEADAFKKESSETKSNIKAMDLAIEALEKGMAGSFLQTDAAATLKRLVKSADMSDTDREAVASFLGDGGSDSYAPASAEITGILKQMKETTEADLEEMISNEKTAVKEFEELFEAKQKEVKALIASAETKTARLGEVSTELVNMMEDLDETKKGLGEDTKFLQDMGTNCATKKDDWEARSKTRSEELLALADTIKILNDDDALDLFKKALPSTSLLQVQVSSKDVMQQARNALGAESRSDAHLDFISLAMRGKNANFNNILGMIDKLITQLGKEQTGDDSKKAYCSKELDVAEDEKKNMERTKSQLETVISEGQNAIEALMEDIANLDAGIKDLDKKVVEATEMRKQENSEYKKEMAANTAAKKLLVMAKERMAKFYEAPSSLVEVSSHRAEEFGAPPPPPETFGAYTKKGSESAGVVNLMKLLISDLDTEIVTGEKEEKDSQASYEKFVADSAKKRATDSLALESKEAAKAQAEETMIKSKASDKAEARKIKANLVFLMNLHKECDWLLANFDVRAKARADEVDSLNQAKAVLSGADYA